MPYCTKCGTKSEEEARFCISCGAVLYTITDGRVEAKVKIDAANKRLCPFCRQSVDRKASRCPHCSAEIGLLENRISCPSCRELVVPAKATTTDEKGLATDLAKLALGGQYYLSSTEESYLACPVCKKPIAYCSKCREVTPSFINRKWVGLGRSKSGYQFVTTCAVCGSKLSGPSCFVATAVLATALDARLLVLYKFRDLYLNRTWPGRQVIRIYYRIGPHYAMLAESSLLVRKVTQFLLHRIVIGLRSKGFSGIEK